LYLTFRRTLIAVLTLWGRTTFIIVGLLLGIGCRGAEEQGDCCGSPQSGVFHETTP
jgi:hypothetical protein